MTTKRRESVPPVSRLPWSDMLKLLVPIVFSIFTAGIALYTKVEVSAQVTSARLSALEDAVKRMPSGDQLDAFRAVVNAEVSSLKSRVDRLEGRHGQNR